MDYADILDTIFKISVSGGGVILTTAAVRIAVGWVRMETKLNNLIGAFHASLEERQRLVQANEDAHKELFLRLNDAEKQIANMRGRQGRNGE